MQLEEKRRYLEHHWVLAGKELDQEKILRQKLQKEQETDYDRALRDEKEKLTNLRKEYERQVQALKTTHVAQVDELKDEVLKANLEADRLHNQLIGSPRQTRLFSKANFWKDSPLRVVSISMVFAVRDHIFENETELLSLCSLIVLLMFFASDNTFCGL